MCWPSALAAVDDTNNRYLFKKETRLDVQWLFKRAAAIVNPVRSIMKIALLLLLIATVQLASSGVDARRLQPELMAGGNHPHHHHHSHHHDHHHPSSTTSTTNMPITTAWTDSP